MGGGGAISAMVTSYRNNQKLRGKKKGMFDSVYDKTGSDDLGSTGVHGKLEIKKLSEEQKAYYRRKTIKANRKAFVIRMIISLTVFGGIVLGLSAIGKQANQRRIGEAQREYAIKLELYNEKIERANALMHDKQYSAATYFYREAMQIFPDKLEVKEFLANSYLSTCMQDGLYCRELITFLDEVIIEYPDNLKFRKLRATYYLNIGEVQRAQIDLDIISGE